MKKSFKKTLAVVLVCLAVILTQFLLDILLLLALEARYQERFLAWFGDPAVLRSLLAPHFAVSLILIFLAVWFAKKFYHEH
jgi:membrane protein implicated in regulation of membrane protease activity